MIHSMKSEEIKLPLQHVQERLDQRTLQLTSSLEAPDKIIKSWIEELKKQIFIDFSCSKKAMVLRKEN